MQALKEIIYMNNQLNGFFGISSNLIELERNFE